MIIYRITNTINNKFYIGQTIFPLIIRWRRHKSSKRYDYLHNSIRKYGPDAFSTEIIEDNICDIDILNEREAYWISFYNTTNPLIGYNARSGGENSIPNEVTRKKLSAASKGKCKSEEHKLAISKAKSIKKYIITDPQGLEFEINNLNVWCKANNMDQGNMAAVLGGRNKRTICKGYKIRYKENNTNVC